MWAFVIQYFVPRPTHTSRRPVRHCRHPDQHRRQARKGDKREGQEEVNTMSDSIRSKIQELENEVKNEGQRFRVWFSTR